MIEYLQSMFTQPWKPVSRPALIAWLVFYLWFLAYAFSAHGRGLFIDTANLVVHEGGHNLFGWFGPTLGLWGGTLLQLLVPFLLAAYFFTERQIPGFVFCSFFFFENWLGIATYMADARAMALPLVTTGDPEFVKHDWNTIFTSLGVLDYDTRIAAVVRIIGWFGMIACVVWLGMRARHQERNVSAALVFPTPMISLVQRYPGKPRTGAPSTTSKEVANVARDADAGLQSTIKNQQSKIPTAPNPQ